MVKPMETRLVTTSRRAAAIRFAENGMRRLARQRFFLTHAEPHGREHTDHQVDDKDAPPPGHVQDRLPDCWRHDRDKNEHEHDERHHTRHGTPLELVPDQREGDRARPRNTNALQDPCGEHHRERAREQREQASGNEERQSNIRRGLAASSIRERTVEQLADSEPEKEQRDDQLIVVRARHGKRGTDRWKRRQHRVDRHRGERRERRHQGDELTKANRRAFRGGHRSAQHTGTGP